MSVLDELNTLYRQLSKESLDHQREKEACEERLTDADNLTTAEAHKLSLREEHEHREYLYKKHQAEGVYMAREIILNQKKQEE